MQAQEITYSLEADEAVTIPVLSSSLTKVAIRVIALRKHPFDFGNLSYLQWSRRKLETGRADYEAKRFLHVEQLSLRAPLPVDALLSPQSDHKFADPYREAIAKKCPAALDLTQRFKRGVARAENGLEQLVKDLRYQVVGDESSFKSLLFIDDIFNGGTTAGAYSTVLFSAGLDPECVITWVSPLWIAKTHS